jgi:hypothetical protein
MELDRPVGWPPTTWTTCRRVRSADLRPDFRIDYDPTVFVPGPDGIAVLTVLPEEQASVSRPHRWRPDPRRDGRLAPGDRGRADATGTDDHNRQ